VVHEALASISDDRDGVSAPGSGPVAFAALPFDRSAAASFVVPALVVGSTTEGERWTTEIPSADPPPPDAAPSARRGEVAVTATMAPEDWCDLVAEATKRIAAGDLQKVVLARDLEARADAPFDPHEIAEHLAA